MLAALSFTLAARDPSTAAHCTSDRPCGGRDTQRRAIARGRRCVRRDDFHAASAASQFDPMFASAFLEAWESGALRTAAVVCAGHRRPGPVLVSDTCLKGVEPLR